MTSEQKAKALAVMNAVEAVSEDLGTLLGKMKKSGKSLAEIAKKMGVTRGAVQAALKRAKA